ncbi:hypothetical protein KR018_007493 [Drosophila ironensis]|nr:hypothetical protein KR018_007493 [Drosophila ironensis]
MLLNTLGLVLLLTGGCWCEIKFSLPSLEHLLHGAGGGYRPSSGHKNPSQYDANNKLFDYYRQLQAYNGYLDQYYNNRYNAWYALYGPYSAYGSRPYPYPYPQPQAPPHSTTTVAPTTSSSTESTPTTSTAIPTSTGDPTTSTAVAPVDTDTTSTAVAPVNTDTTSTAVATESTTTVSPTTSTAVATADTDTTSTAVAPVDTDTTSTAVASESTTTASPTTSTAVAPVDTDTTSTAVAPARVFTTPIPYHIVHSSLISPYDVHRIQPYPQPIYVHSPAVSSAAGAQPVPVYVPYDPVYHRSDYNRYFQFVGKK